MIIARTPLAISGGALIAVKQYTYTQTRELPETFDFNYHIAWGIDERVNEIKQIKHPAVRKILQEFCPTKRLCIAIGGDMPRNAGYGSKGAFVVSFMHSLFFVLKGVILPKKELYDLCLGVSEKILNETGQAQDIYLSVYGSDKIAAGSFGRIVHLCPNGRKIFLSPDLNGSALMKLTSLET